MGEIFWYKYHALHGGGHQQETTEYHYSEYKLTEEMECEYLATWCAQFRNVRGTIEAVHDAPPKEAVIKLLAEAELRLASAEHDVAVLRNETRYQGFLDENKLR